MSALLASIAVVTAAACFSGVLFVELVRDDRGAPPSPTVSALVIVGVMSLVWLAIFVATHLG